MVRHGMSVNNLSHIKSPGQLLLSQTSFSDYCVLDHIQDPHSSWACGRFGAIAEFDHDADEPVEFATAHATGEVIAAKS
jgi:hypothetical protein